MNKRHFIEEYLQGRQPLHAERPTLPDEAQLDAAEREFDRLVEAAQSRRMRRRRTLRWTAAAAAVILLAVGIGMADFGQRTSDRGQRIAEGSEQTAKCDTAKHDVQLAHVPQPVPVETTREKKIATAGKKKTARKTNPAAVSPSPPAEPEAPILATAADSLEYYITRLEEKLGDCHDSACLAQLTELIRADERINRLVEKLLHRQVEQAAQFEIMVDTTADYLTF